MADVPSAVAYGQVVGRFVKFIADTGDVAAVPDEVPLTGKVILTPQTTVIRWPSTTPPRLAVADVVTCLVTAGDLAAPDGTAGGVYVIATDQPQGQPNTCQWRATFEFDNVKAQPPAVLFNVPTSGVVDISQAVEVPPAPPIQQVVTNESLEAAEAAATHAEAAAILADQSAQEAHDWASSVPTGPAGPQGPQGVAGPQGVPGPTGPQGAPGVIVLSAAAPVPGGTPAGTIVLRTAT